MSRGLLKKKSIKTDLWNLSQRKFHGTIRQNYENNHQVKKILMAISVEMRKTGAMWQ